MRPAAIAQKLDELLQLTKQTRTKAEDIHRAVSSVAGSSVSCGTDALGSNVLANSSNSQSRKNAGLLVQIAVALLTLGALLCSAASYTLSRNMGHKQLRPWITMYTVQLARDFSVTMPTSVNLSAKNTGQTPALNLEWTYDEGMFTGGRCYLKSDIFVSPSSGAVGLGEIVSNAGVHINALLPPCLDDLKTGASVFSVRGTLRYDDIFGEHHFTNFCFHTTKLSTAILVACEEHNDLD